MNKKIAFAMMGGVASLAVSGATHAEHFDFDPGMGSSIFEPDLAAGDGMPYD